jgi:hypothetical protein
MVIGLLALKYDPFYSSFKVTPKTKHEIHELTCRTFCGIQYTVKKVDWKFQHPDRVPQIKLLSCRIFFYCHSSFFLPEWWTDRIFPTVFVSSVGKILAIHRNINIFQWYQLLGQGIFFKCITNVGNILFFHQQRRELSVVYIAITGRFLPSC